MGQGPRGQEIKGKSDIEMPTAMKREGQTQRQDGDKIREIREKEEVGWGWRKKQEEEERAEKGSLGHGLVLF